MATNLKVMLPYRLRCVLANVLANPAENTGFCRVWNDRRGAIARL